jgi:hypothetical protein
MYWAEWGRVRDVLRSRGRSTGEIEATRHTLHRKALGKDRSSKALTNAELDVVLAAFKAVSEGGNLEAQLRQLDQPDWRRGELERRILRLAVRCGIEGGEAGLVAYLGHFFRGRQLRELDERELQKAAGILARRARQLGSEPPDNPF